MCHAVHAILSVHQVLYQKDGSYCIGLLIHGYSLEICLLLCVEQFTYIELVLFKTMAPAV